MLLLATTSVAQDNSAPVLVFQGNQRYSSADLLHISGENWEQYCKQKHLSYIDDAAYQILEYYRQNGYCFAEIDYEVQGQQVIFHIQENSQVLVTKIILKAHDPKISLAFPQDKLQGFITKPALLEESFFYRQQIEKDVSAIHDFYVSEGYLKQAAKIVYHFSPEPPESKEVEVEIIINEGPLFYISQLVFHGNTNISSSELTTALEFKEPILYVPGLQQRMAKNLQEYYRCKGYAQTAITVKISDISSDATQINSAKQHTPQENINAGPQENINGGPQENINGGPQENINGGPQENINGGPQEKQNAIAQDHLNTSPQSNIISGEQDTSAHPPNKQNRVVEFTIVEGDINYIGKISIHGHERTQDYVILQQLDIADQERYDLEKIRSSSQNLYDTGIFNLVEIKENFVTPDKTDLEIILEERNARILTFNLGYATSYGPAAGVEYEHVNWLGKGWKLNMALETTLFAGELDKSQAIISVTEPYFFGSRTWGFTFKTLASYEVTPTFTVFDRGAGFIFEKRFNRYLTGQFGYTLLFSEILEVEESNEDDIQVGTTLFSTLNQKLILNLRDNNSYPTSGSYHFIELEQSLSILAADTDYFKIYGHTAWYFRVYKQWVLSMALRAGVIMPFGDSDEVPIQRRYFGGGVQSIRSFAEKQLPPWDSEDNPIGGEGIFLFSTELRIPVYSNFGVSLFGDIGQLIPVVRSMSDYRLDHFKYALGGSIWYNTPIGPIRFDMGFNPDRENNPLTGKKESLFAWFISIGFSF